MIIRYRVIFAISNNPLDFEVTTAPIKMNMIKSNFSYSQ